VTIWWGVTTLIEPERERNLHQRKTPFLHFWVNRHMNEAGLSGKPPMSLTWERCLAPARKTFAPFEEYRSSNHAEITKAGCPYGRNTATLVFAMGYSYEEYFLRRLLFDCVWRRSFITSA
jgi:hypothetical protein